MLRNLWLVLIVGGVALAAGCKGSDSGVAIDSGGKAALEDLGAMLKSLADEGRKPPSRLADLESVEPMMPVAAPAIRNGDIVYIWGAGHLGGGKQVVAYEKQAPTDGGHVLLQDGTVIIMSASEFQSAPKAK